MPAMVNMSMAATAGAGATAPFAAVAKPKVAKRTGMSMWRMSILSIFAFASIATPDEPSRLSVRRYPYEDRIDIDRIGMYAWSFRSVGRLAAGAKRELHMSRFRVCPAGPPSIKV
jgi:hypothetical protein